MSLFGVVSSEQPQQSLGLSFLVVQLGFAVSLVVLGDAKASRSFGLVRGLVAVTGGLMALSVVGLRSRALRPRVADVWCGIASAALWVLVGANLEAHPWPAWML